MYAQYNSKLVHRGQNDVIHNRHRPEATTLEPQNNHGPLPILSFQVLQFPLFVSSGHTNKYKYKPLLNISKITF
jgi:hypothetical protein